MNTSLAIEIDQPTLERFETVLPDGSVFDGFIAGGQIIFPGHRDTRQAASQAQDLAALCHDLDWLDERFTRGDIDAITERSVSHRWAVPTIDETSDFLLEWHDADLLLSVVSGDITMSSVSASALTRNSIPVTTIEL